MRVLYIGNGLTHYFNLVLSRLNREPGVELSVVVPQAGNSMIGDGVYQTKEGIDFNFIELPEVRRLNFYTTFVGLAEQLRQLRPDVVIAAEPYLRAFVLDLPIVAAMRSTGASLILKSIPFKYTNYQDRIKEIESSKEGFASLPSWINRLLVNSGLISMFKRVVLSIDKQALNRPDAHVNYVEAYAYWESYGVDRTRVFVTRNSPNTDMLFATREKLEKQKSDISKNPQRLLHVGRLVAWKRVDMLIRAFSRVRRRFPAAELVIIGDGPELEALEALSESLALGTSVSFPGGVYDQITLGKLCMGSALYAMAGMGGLSINDAMCFGLPVLCSVGDGTEKFLVREGENGRFFSDGDEDDLVEKILWFLMNPEKMTTMGKKSVEIIRNEVNIHTVIAGYMMAINSVHAGNKSKPLSK